MDNLDDPGLAKAQPPPAQRLGSNQVAGFGIECIAGIDGEFPPSALVRGPEPCFAADFFEDSQSLARRGGDGADGPAFEFAVAGGSQTRQHPVAGAGGRMPAVALDHIDAGCFAVAIPVHGPGQQIAVAVGAGDFDHRHRRQGFGFPHAAALFLFKGAVQLHLAKRLFQGHLLARVELESAGDLALADPLGA